MIGLGIVGLGVATKGLLPSIHAHPDFEIVAVAEPRDDVRLAFSADFGVPGYRDVAELCRDRSVDAVYVASPHQFHRTQSIIAAEAGKHVLVEKPMALTLDDCEDMIVAAERSGVALVVGHTNGFDAPILELREIAAQRTYGSLRMIHTFHYSEFLYRPRRPEELDTAQGGGIMFNQFPHQVEIVRTIAPAPVTTVRATCGRWDERRPTEGSIMAMLHFADGVVASLVYNGYGHFDTELMITGLDAADQTTTSRRGARAKLAGLSADEEAESRVRSGYLGTRRGVLQPKPADHLYERFGVTIASFDHADIVPNGIGLMIHGDEDVREVPVAPGRGGAGRSTVFDELSAAVAGRRVVHDGRWGKTTLAVCLAALRSSQCGREITISTMEQEGE